MHLSPAVLEAAYTYLRATTRLFKTLPDAEAVEFHVIARSMNIKHFLYADFELKDGQHIIRLNSKAHKTHAAVLASMAHEMCHAKQRVNESKASAMHGPKFKRLAAQVCKQHGFDLATF